MVVVLDEVQDYSLQYLTAALSKDGTRHPVTEEYSSLLFLCFASCPITTREFRLYQCKILLGCSGVRVQNLAFKQ